MNDDETRFGRLVRHWNGSIGLHFLLLELSGGTEVFHVCAFDRAVELERSLIVVLKAHRRSEVDAEVEAIVGGKDRVGR